VCCNSTAFGTLQLPDIAEIWTRTPDGLPRTASPDWLDVHIARWREAAARTDDAALQEFAAQAADLPLLRAAFGNSPYLSQSLIGDPAFARTLLEEGPDPVFDRLLAGISEAPPADEDQAGLQKRLRIAKRQAALAIGLADISGAWPLERVTGALSSFAGAALTASCRLLLRRAHDAGDLALPHPERPDEESGLIVLGMGKLGAFELNYSSDIDLIVLYDEEKVPYTGEHGQQHLFTRMARNLVSLMDERTRDGYVFRTDLRLRPDPGATPPAIAMFAAELYYESAGQNWERAAMTKARPVAGDLESGHAFLDILRPFMWRRSLDFAAIQDIQSIKRQINAHRGGSEIAVAGHNIKLGRGGIREIEFFAQTQLLIWGGREPNLRVRGTLEALDRLVEAGHVAKEVAEDLERSYLFHRKLEHRLQMVDDRQTHEIPEDDAGLAQIAAFMGFDSADAFVDALLDRLRAVERHYAALFEDEGDLAGGGNLVFTGSEDDPDTVKTLAGMGFADPAAVSTTIRAWHTGRSRARRSARARELLTELVPSILEAFADSPNPDAALMRFDDFLQRLPAGVQLFSLFTAHPGLFDLVAEIMGAAPRLAGWLSRYPILLDGVLGRDFFDFLPTAEEMREDLGDALTQARDFQDRLDIERRWANDRIFQIGVHMLRGRLSPVDASEPLSDVADTCLAALLPPLHEEFAEAHGRVPGGAFAVVAFGKLGSREMTVGSDLDLLFVYDHEPDAAESDGPKPLTPGQYYARLCQRFIGAVTAPTGEGRLYEVDMRLRPAGNAGPIASSLEAFSRYQHTDAWTWEHQALTRARVVCSEGGLGERFEAVIRDVLTMRRDPEKLRADIASMRERMRREFGSQDIWSVKHLRGGLVDIEFIAQYLQLRHGTDCPEILTGNTDATLAVARRHGLVPETMADDLAAAAQLWRNVQGILRLTVEEGFSEETAPSALKTVVARACGMVDFAALKETMSATAVRTAYHFKTLLGEADI
jgi:glutamate-ammonia-ligase adenylyltransferase